MMLLVFRVTCNKFSSSNCCGSLDRNWVFAEGSRIQEGVSAAGLKNIRRRKCGNETCLPSFRIGLAENVLETNSVER